MFFRRFFFVHSFCLMRFFHIWRFFFIAARLHWASVYIASLFACNVHVQVGSSTIFVFLLVFYIVFVLLWLAFSIFHYFGFQWIPLLCQSDTIRLPFECEIVAAAAHVLFLFHDHTGTKQQKTANGFADVYTKWNKKAISIHQAPDLNGQCAQLHTTTMVDEKRGFEWIFTPNVRVFVCVQSLAKFMRFGFLEYTDWGSFAIPSERLRCRHLVRLAQIKKIIW